MSGGLKGAVGGVRVQVGRESEACRTVPAGACYATGRSSGLYSYYNDYNKPIHVNMDLTVLAGLKLPV